MKENDWIVANLENSDMDPGQFRTIGMDSNNTQMLSKEEYLKSDYIKNNNAFKDDNGNFSKKKFNDFYNSLLNSFKTFSDIDSGFQYDMFDFRRFNVKNANVKDPKLTLGKEINPDETTIGNGWINQKVESELSTRELAEKNKVFDSSAGKFLDYSPNEHALLENPLEWFKDIFKEPLVLATYDEDSNEINPLTGNPIRKGDKKINADGKYYYETLNGRNLSGKEVLSGWDTLTVDGTNFNKIDFFDSDDKDKSIGGIFMNRAVSLAPMFIGGPVGTAYGALLVGRELLKTLPSLDGVFGAITNTDTPFTRLANNLAGKASAGNISTSDQGLSSLLTLESLTNTLADVALQWQLQRVVAEAILKLSGASKLEKSAEASAKAMYDKQVPIYKQRYLDDIAKYKAADKLEEATALELEMEKAVGLATTNWKDTTIGAGLLQQEMISIYPKMKQMNDLGNDLSLWYMIMASNNDVYSDMLDKGLSKREALAVTLGSTLGMYKVDTSGLGEVFFKLLATDGERAIRATLKDRSSEWLSSIAKYTKGLKEVNPNKRFSNIFAKANEWGSKMFSQFWDDIKHHSGGFFTKALGEGLEEAGEELTTDISKLIYELIHDIKPLNSLFGGLTTDNVGAFSDFTNNDHAIADIFQRYAGNFMGGFLGGGVFYGKEVFDNKNWHRDLDLNKLQHVIREFGLNEALRVLDEYHKEGKLGNTNLGINFLIDSDGKPIFLSANSENNINQNDFVYNQLKHEILGVSKILEDNDLMMSDGEIYDGATLSELRFQKLKEILGESDYLQGYVERFDNLCTKLILTEEEINKLNEKDDLYKRTDEFSSKLSKLNKLKKEILDTLDAFKSGENAIDYMGKTLFVMDPEMNKDWYVGDMTSWLKIRKGISLEEYLNLSEEETKDLQKEWDKERKNLAYTQDEAWEAYKYFGEQIKPELLLAQESMKQFKESAKVLLEINDPETSPLNNVEYVKVSDFSEDAEDPTFLIDYETDRLIKDDGTLESVADLASRIQQPGEEFEDFTKRKNQVIEKLKKQHAANLNRQRSIEALKKARDIIVRSGNILDKTTQRELLLRMLVTQKDIIDDLTGRIYRFDKLLPGLGDKVMEIMSKVKKLEDLQLALDDIIELSKLDELDNLKYDINKKFNIINILHEECDTDKFVKVDDIITTLNGRILYYKLMKNLFKSIPELIDDDGNIDLNKFKELYKQELINQGISDADADSKLNNIFEYFNNSSNTTEINNVLHNIGLDPSIKSVLEKESQFIKVNKYAECSDVLEESDLNKEFIKQFFNNADISKVLLLYNSGELDKDLISDSINFVGKDSMENYITDDDTGEYSLWLDNINNSIELSERLSKMDGVIKNKFQALESGIRGDDLFDVIESIKNVKAIDNPITNIVKKLALVMHRDAEGIELVLQLLQDNMLNDKKEKFELTQQQRDTLEEAKDLLKLARSYLYGTWNSADLLNPFPHNLFMNDVIQKNKLKMDLMPTIDDEVAKLYDQEINNLILEIGEIDDKGNYTPGSWLRWDLLHALNKPKQFIDSENSLYQSHLNYFINYKDKFSGTITDGSGSNYEFDILDGMDSAILDSDPFIANYKLENLIYKNLHKIKEDTGKSFSQILNATGITNILKTKQDELLNQDVSNLDGNIKSGNLKPMDIGVYLATLASLSPEEFYAYLKASKALPDDRVPLGIQLYVAQIGIAYSQNKEDFNDVMSWVYDLVNYEHGSIYCMDGIFISGNGGAGKTDAVVRYINDYLINVLKKSKKNIIVTAPKESQRKNLQAVTGCKSLTPEELCKYILGENEYSDLKSKAKDLTNYNKQISVRSSVGHENKVAVCASDVEFKDVKIDAIILDEGTHFSTLTHSILSAYATLKNIPLIILGDNLLQGYKEGGVEANLNQERVFIARTPRLAVTLRDSNYLKLTNNNLLAYITQEFNSVPANPSIRNIKIEEAFKKLNEVKLFSYQGSEINGDSLVTSIDKVYAQKLKEIILPNGTIKKTKIGYVGPKDDKYNELKIILGDQLADPIEEVDIQGLEFDHVIVNLTWNDCDYSKYPDNDDKHIVGIKFLRRLYTLSTRGKTSVTFVDDGVLSKLVKFETQNYKNSITNFNESTKATLKEHFKNNLEKLKLPEVSMPEPSSTETSGPTLTGSAETEENDSIGESMWDEEDDFVEINKNPSNSDTDELELIALDEKVDEKLRTRSYMEKQLRGFGRAYGDASMLGIPRSKESDAKNSPWIWDYSKVSTSDILEDTAIFWTPDLGEHITNGKIKNQLTKKLLALKCMYLYNLKTDTDLAKNLWRLYFLDTFSENDFVNLRKNTKFKLVVSHVNPDKHNFIGNTGLSLNKAEINGDGENDSLVYRLVADFEINGKNCRLTLGLLSDPKTYADNRDSILLDILSIVNDEDISELQKATDMSEYSKTVDSNIKSYKNFLDKARSKWMALNNSKAELALQIKDNLVIFDGNTVLRSKQYQSYIDEIGDIQKVRLDHFGWNPKAGQLTDFEEANSYTVVSPVYLYKHDSSKKSNSLKFIEGKPVIFVSNNIALNSDQLLSVWMSERNSSQRSVRMIRLDNAGVTMSDLCNRNYTEFFATDEETEGDKKHKLPVETKRLAIRLLVALHNFRANLKKFTLAFETYDKFDFLSVDNLDDLLNELHNQYKIYSESHKKDDLSEKGFRKWFEEEGDKSKVSLEFAKNVWEFNDELESKYQIKLFRLGTGNDDIGEDHHKNHWQIRNMNLPKHSKTYGGSNDDTRNGIYLDKTGLKLLSDVINGIYDIISPLGIKLYQVRTEANGKEKEETKIVYDENTFIDPSKDFGKRGIVNSITSHDEDGYTWGIEDASGKTFSPKNVARWTRLFPSLLMKINTRAMAYRQTQVYEDGPNKGKRYLPAVAMGLDKQVKDRLWDWDASGSIKLKEYEGIGDAKKVKKTITLTGIKDFITNNENIPEILDLCFHGTSNTKGLIDSQLYHIIKTKNGETIHDTPTPQCTDAMFKQGFFIDPEAKIGGWKTGGISYNQGEGLFVLCQTNLSLFLVRAAVDAPTFSINLDFEEETSKTNPESKPKTKEDLLLESNVGDLIKILQSANLEDYPKLKSLLESVGIISLLGLDIKQDSDNIKITTTDKIYTIDLNNNKILKTDNIINPDPKETFNDSDKMISDVLKNEVFLDILDLNLKDNLVKLMFLKKSETEPSYVQKILAAINSGKSSEEISLDINNVIDELFAEIESSVTSGEGLFKDVSEDYFYNDINDMLNNIKPNLFCTK